MEFPLGSVPVAIAAKVYGKEPHWVEQVLYPDICQSVMRHEMDKE